MRARSATGTAVGALALALGLAAAACGGGGGAQIQLPSDARDARDAVDGSAGSGAPEDGGLDVSTDTGPGPDGPAPETGPGPDGPAPETGPGPDGPAPEVAGDRPAEAPAPDAGADRGEAGTDARTDLRVEKPPATASWTIAPHPMCTAAGAGCMDLGMVGGYQVTASGTCPTASSVQLWFPGGSSLPAAGNYAVKPAAGILDIINMPAGMVGVLAERDDAAMKHFRYWGRSGTATVSVSGVGRRVIFSGLTIREETSGTMTTLGGDATCY